jgi:hypothetical protein
MAFGAGVGVGVDLFCNNEFYVPESGFRMILEPVANPSDTFSAIDLRCGNLITSASGRDVGGSGFMVNV